jgi:hypothetical protein
MNDEEISEMRDPIALHGQREKKSYQEIADSLESRHHYGEQLAKEQSKEALEELYASEFPIDDPPESFERYEAELTVRHLREAVESLAGRYTERLEIQVQHVYDGSEAAKTETETQIQVDDEAVDSGAIQRRQQQCKQIIDVMATYGALAEPHISALSGEQVLPAVRTHAIETLAEMRDGTGDSQSLTEAIRDWWRGDG